MAGKTIAELSIKLSTQTAELKKGLSKANKNLSKFQKQSEKFSKKISGAFKGMGVAIAGAFALSAIKNFAKESANLAAQTQGVSKAFEKFKDYPEVLRSLKIATRGTVSELELMQQAIKAENFSIPMDVLARGLEFATKRAAQTGESVDYLVDSFVTGLGRKSVLILDNLGISALALNAEVAKTGDFMKAVGNITERELTKMGDVLLTDAQRMQQLKAEAENAKVAFGELVLKGLAPFREAILKITQFTLIQDLEKQKSDVNDLATTLLLANVPLEDRNRAYDQLKKLYPDILAGQDKENVNLETLRESLNFYNEVLIANIALESLSAEENRILSDRGRASAKLIKSQSESLQTLNVIRAKYNKQIEDTPDEFNQEVVDGFDELEKMIKDANFQPIDENEWNRIIRNIRKDVDSFSDGFSWIKIGSAVDLLAEGSSIYGNLVISANIFKNITEATAEDYELIKAGIARTREELALLATIKEIKIPIVEPDIRLEDWMTAVPEKESIDNSGAIEMAEKEYKEAQAGHQKIAEDAAEKLKSALEVIKEQESKSLWEIEKENYAKRKQEIEAKNREHISLMELDVADRLSLNEEMYEKGEISLDDYLDKRARTSDEGRDREANLQMIHNADMINAELNFIKAMEDLAPQMNAAYDLEHTFEGRKTALKDLLDSFVISQHEYSDKLAGINEEQNAAQIAADTDKITNQREILGVLFQNASKFSNDMVALIDRQKADELSKVGDNAKKRYEIEKKYFYRQKSMAMAQAAMNAALAITNIIANVPLSVLNPAAWVGIALAGAIGATQMGIIGSQTFEGMAQGGIAYGETLANVGEYPGARSNPEVIAPLSDLEGLLSTNIGGTVLVKFEDGAIQGKLEYDERVSSSF